LGWFQSAASYFRRQAAVHAAGRIRRI
jgi:hypothetical protein